MIAKMAKLKNYRDFIKMGFVPVDLKSVCLQCGAILTHNFMNGVKLELHRRSRQSSPVGKYRVYFENKKEKTACPTI